MKFENRKDKEGFPEPESLSTFKERIKGWRTLPEGTDYCPRCWANLEKNKRLSEDSMKTARPTSDFVEQRKGTDGWSAVCQEGGEEVFVELEY
ncbi:MAG: hypothetical protein Q8P49_01195 [Candidatus Liptonbacteria bacterium]|nr:hypothetical protein [Candidatus Liptonbacteria bacterium]